MRKNDVVKTDQGVFRILAVEENQVPFMPLSRKYCDSLKKSVFCMVFGLQIIYLHKY